VPTYYVSRELLAAAARTELPDDIVFEAIPFDALVFMVPKGTRRLNGCTGVEGTSSLSHMGLGTH
jgi:hypothetical protein